MKCCSKELPSRCSAFHCFWKCADRNPRFVSIVCGIVLPLFGLDAICFGMGRWIAELEGPQEIINNNALLQAAAYRNYTANLVSNITARAPAECFYFYQTNRTEEDLSIMMNDLFDLLVEDDDFTTRVEAFQKFETMLLTQAQEAQSDATDALLGDGNGTDTGDLVLVNITDAYQFLEFCGDHFRDTVQTILYQLVGSDGLESPDLTFDWNRCTPHLRTFTRSQYEVSLRPPNQQEYFTQLWLEDRVEIYDDMLETLAQNLSHPLSRILAFENSTQLATGGAGCKSNTASAAWFWFTVMSTVGYGNMTVNTFETRLLVYTVGLLSILAFGTVLVTAGHIIGAIFDDAFRRLRLEGLTIPWVASIFWGLMYYGWMGVISVHYYHWNKVRLGEEGMVTSSESYWFSYISTTTIGFGDYVLMPDVMLAEDVVLWPTSFLVGFVFFAAFIGKLGETMSRPLQREGISLVERLKAEHPIGTMTENAPIESTDGDEGEPKTIAKSSEEEKPLDDPIDEEQLILAGDRSADFSMESEQAEKAPVGQIPGDDESSLATGTEASVFSVKMESLAKGYVD